MSRDSILDELPIEKSEMEHYEPGDSTYVKLADTILRRMIADSAVGATLYEALDRARLHSSFGGFMYQQHRHRCEYLEELLQEYLPRDFQAQLFLDTILFHSLHPRQDIEDEQIDFSRLTTLGNPLIQALYRSGYNDLTLDLTCLPLKTGEVASYLSGKADESLGPLRLTVSTDYAANVGAYVKNCDITVVGDVQKLGFKAEESVFRSTHEVIYSGRLAKNSDFYLNSALSIDVREERGHHGGPPKYADGCNYFISSEVSALEKAWLEDSHFFSPHWRDERCYLYVPDEAGQWEEVLPE